MHIWVIEIFEKGKWYPTAGAHPFRKDARSDIKYYWRFTYPTTKFRIRKYVSDSIT